MDKLQPIHPLRYGQGWVEVWDFINAKRAKGLHNNTPADIARAICTGIKALEDTK